MFLITDFIDLVGSIESLIYIFAAFGFLGINLSIRLLVLKKGI